MELKYATGVVALAVLLALPAAKASFEVNPNTCKPNSFKWASSCFKTITAGGTTFQSKAGLTLQGDQYFSTKAPIVGGGDLTRLYQQECAAKDIKLALPVPKGYYRVTIYEAEIYFVKPTDDDNKYMCPRIFSICGENYMWENDLCLYQKGVNTAYPITRTIYVDDGTLNVHFWSSVNMPKLAGVLVEGLNCTGTNSKLRTGPKSVSQVCVNAFAGKLPPPPAAAPTAGANGTTNGTAGNGTEVPAGAPGSFGLPAGAPVHLNTSRSLPMLGGKPITTAITQYSASADGQGIAGAPDGVLWPAGGNNTTATATFGVPTTAAALTATGAFTKGDKVDVTINGTDAAGKPVTRDIRVTAPTNGKTLKVPMPKDLANATIAGVRIKLPAGSKAKIDALQLKGNMNNSVLTTLQHYDPTTGFLIQWPISANDSANSPGLNGAGTNAILTPDGALWAPTGNGTRSIALNYTDAATNASSVLLAGAPKRGANVSILAHSDASSDGVLVYNGPIEGANGTYGTYVLPLNASAVPANTTALTLSTTDPTALALDSAALVGAPADPSRFNGTADQNAAQPAGGAAGSSSRDLVLPVATKAGTWASNATTGSAVIPSQGTVPAGILDGTPANGATGQPDGKTVALPAASARAAAGATPFLALDYPDGKKGNLVSVAGKAVAPGSLTVAVVDADGKITNLGAKALPDASNAATYVNFTTPDNKDIDIKKVVLTATPASSWLTDAVAINKGSTDPRSGGKSKHKGQRINGSHAAWIAVVTIFSILGFCLCCCLPCLLLWCLRNRRKNRAAAGTSNGTYAAAPQRRGLFGRKKATGVNYPPPPPQHVAAPVVKNPAAASNV